MNFSSNHPCYPKIYYDLGQGFNEIESVIVRYRTAGETVRLRFDLPTAEVKRFRFDPSESHCQFRVSALSLDDLENEMPLPLSSLQPLNQIAETGCSQSEFYATTTEDANDPSILITV
ncbi:MAG: hypothetical protein HKN85_04780 [Gammaproteobacteria bacterium]|nr:hypothetical protein [Gammaproteobacteria bacterium]